MTCGCPRSLTHRLRPDIVPIPQSDSLAEAPEGPMDFTLRGQQPRGNTCQLEGTVDVFVGDVDGDANHDGTIDDDGEDDDLGCYPSCLRD